MRILGINQAGEEAGNALITAGRDLPWLQETIDHPVWVPWNVEWRDVVILNGDNTVFAVYNLTDHPLDVQANYDEIKALLQSAAGAR